MFTFAFPEFMADSELVSGIIAALLADAFDKQEVYRVAGVGGFEIAPAEGERYVFRPVGHEKPTET